MWKWLIILSLYSGVVMSDIDERIQNIVNKTGINKRFVTSVFKQESALGRLQTGDAGKSGGLGHLYKSTALRQAKDMKNEELYDTLKKLNTDMSPDLSNLQGLSNRSGDDYRKGNIPSRDSEYSKYLQNNPKIQDDLLINLFKDIKKTAIKHHGSWEELSPDQKYSYWNASPASAKKYVLGTSDNETLKKNTSCFMKRWRDSAEEGTPENTTGIFRPEKEELTQLRKEQEPEFTPDLINELLSQGGQSQEVMTRRPKSYDEMSFRDAFNQAWRDKGEGDVFNWKGKPYLLKRK